MNYMEDDEKDLGKLKLNSVSSMQTVSSEKLVKCGLSMSKRIMRGCLAKKEKVIKKLQGIGAKLQEEEDVCPESKMSEEETLGEQLKQEVKLRAVKGISSNCTIS